MAETKRQEAFIIEAFNKHTGEFYKYFAGGEIIIRFTERIWKAKFFMTQKTAEKYLKICQARSENANNTFWLNLGWKICTVHIDKPIDLNEYAE